MHNATSTQPETLRDKIRREKIERAERYAGYNALIVRAHAEGMRAGREANPVPMIVSGHGSSYWVDDGACGFAWVTIRPATSSFARWLMKEGIARKAYYGGAEIWVREFGQGIARKEAYAVAFAKVLADAGINAVAGSRLD